MTIDDFVTMLANTAVPPHTFNQYAIDRPENAARRHNLSQYLRQMQPRQPTILLVGEAPGYRGCRLTGIPFVSPVILQTGTVSGLFGVANGWQAINEWPEIQREASATIVWETLDGLDPLPLLWNAFPFHPYRPDQPQSNRTPKKSELMMGRPFLDQLLQIFPIQTIVAVGNKAAQALTSWGIAHDKVRHPSHGGRLVFRHGIRQIMGMN
ncbi:MAG: uracil-DNA glycosylase [Ardenticatenaceae bacterium]|nr:uracil-DNA glycosylase [Ardenticatenaceae bacterium]MCB9443287.1 uracil-DNA glycosylase [Ardenticatenaceae bacterium]